MTLYVIVYSTRNVPHDCLVGFLWDETRCEEVRLMISYVCLGFCWALALSSLLPPILAEIHVRLVCAL